MTVSRLLARPLLASMFVVGGAGSLKDPSGKVPAAKPVIDTVVPALQKAVPQVPIPTDPTTLVRINGAAQLLAGLALATGRAPRTSAAVLAATLLPTTAAGHRFWEETDKGTRSAQQIHFFKNVSMLGGLLIAGVDTEGRPGVAWRASHAVGSARRSGKQLRRAARTQAKLASKSVKS
jgi:putative oxidoreductase